MIIVRETEEVGGIYESCRFSFMNKNGIIFYVSYTSYTNYSIRISSGYVFHS